MEATCLANFFFASSSTSTNLHQRESLLMFFIYWSINRSSIGQWSLLTVGSIVFEGKERLLGLAREEKTRAPLKPVFHLLLLELCCNVEWMGFVSASSPICYDGESKWIFNAHWNGNMQCTSHNPFISLPKGPWWLSPKLGQMAELWNLNGCSFFLCRSQSRSCDSKDHRHHKWWFKIMMIKKCIIIIIKSHSFIDEWMGNVTRTGGWKTPRLNNFLHSVSLIRCIHIHIKWHNPIFFLPMFHGIWMCIYGEYERHTFP